MKEKTSVKNEGNGLELGYTQDCSQWSQRFRMFSLCESLELHKKSANAHKIKHIRQKKTATFRCHKCDKPNTNIKSLERHMKKHGTL